MFHCIFDVTLGTSPSHPVLSLLSHILSTNFLRPLFGSSSRNHRFRPSRKSQFHISTLPFHSILSHLLSALLSASPSPISLSLPLLLSYLHLSSFLTFPLSPDDLSLYLALSSIPPPLPPPPHSPAHLLPLI